MFYLLNASISDSPNSITGSFRSLSLRITSFLGSTATVTPSSSKTMKNKYYISDIFDNPQDARNLPSLSLSAILLGPCPSGLTMKEFPYF